MIGFTHPEYNDPEYNDPECCARESALSEVLAMEQRWGYGRLLTELMDLGETWDEPPTLWEARSRLVEILTEIKMEDR